MNGAAATSLLAPIAIFASVAAQAQPLPPFYEIKWRIDAPAPEQAGRTVTVKPGELFMKARLLPAAAARLDADVRDRAGKVLIASGTELIGARSSLPIYCDTRQKLPGIGAVMMGGPALKQYCLVDEARDGRFDYYFAARSLINGVPFLSGRVPGKPAGTTDAAYSAIQPADMAGRFFVALEYEGKPLLYDPRNFRLTFGIDRRAEQLTDWFYTSGGQYPQAKDYMGARFTVLSEREGSLDIRIDAPFPAQSFGVIKTIEHRSY